MTPAPPPRPVLLGTSGYHYADWQPAFYPAHLGKHGWLDFYAGVFPALEVNATYYGTPRPESARRLARQAAGRLAVAVKAPGDLTHRGLADAATLAPFLEYLAPLRDAGALLAVLLQFPAALRHDAPAREAVRRALRCFAGDPVAVELRHASWDVAEADRFLQDAGASRVAVDQPGIGGLSQSLRFVATGPLAYFRFHGRNAAAWYGGAGGSGDERYRYRYAREELAPWVPVVREAAGRATTTVAFFNNHPDGNAVQDAAAFAGLLGQRLELPESGDLFGQGPGGGAFTGG